MDPLTTWTTHSRTFFHTFISHPTYTTNYTTTPLVNFTRLARTLHWPLPTYAHNWTQCFNLPFDEPSVLPPHGGNAYFEQFRAYGFVPNSSNRLDTEFARLARHMGWTQDRAWYTQRAEAYAAEVRGFFGEEVGRLEGWQLVCGMLFVGAVPGSIAQCRKALKDRFVNLVDLMDSRRVRVPVRVFGSLAALERYTRSRKRTFPLDAAKEGGLVRNLLGDFRPVRHD